MLLQLGYEIGTGELVVASVLSDTVAALRHFQEAHQLAVTGEVDVATADLLQRERDALDEWERPRFVVGRVEHADGVPAVDLTVCVSDRDLRREQELNAATTDADGLWRVSYTRGQFNYGDKGTADIVVRVRRGDKVVYDPGITGIVFNAPDLLVSHVALPTTEHAVRSEYERLFAAITPHLDGVELSGLREDDEVADATFLAAETGLDQGRIEYFGLAQIMAAAHQIPAAFFYCLFISGTLVRAGGATGVRVRVGLSTQPDALFHDIALLPEATVRETVLSAVDAKLVPARLLGQLEEIVAELARARPAAEAYLHDARPAALAGLTQAFLAAGGHEHVLAAVQDLADTGDLTTLVDRLRQAGHFHTDAAATAASTSIAIAHVLGYDQPLVEHVQASRAIANPTDVSKLAALSHHDWADVLRAASPGLTAPPLVDVHAAAMVRRMEKAYPTAAFVAHLRRDQAALGEHGPAMLDVLDAHPDIDLTSANLDTVLRDSPAAPSAAARDQLKTVQRVFKLAPMFAQATALLDAGIHSAAGIKAMGRARFLTTATRSGAFTLNEADQTFRRAVDLHVATGLLAGQLQATSPVAGLPSVSPAIAPGVLDKVTADFPNFRALFGGGNYGACDDCQSVHSASAYFVDTLEFLKHRLVIDTTATTPTPTKTAKEVLFAQRPDLGDIDLTCANTDTAVPYLDVVCELLEDAIAPDPGTPYSGDLTAAGGPTPQTGSVSVTLLAALRAKGWPFSDAAVVFPPDLAGDQIVRDEAVVVKLVADGSNWRLKRLKQTSGTEQERSAAPEFVNEDTYRILGTSTYAFGLPFNLAHEECSAYFKQFGVARADLMRALKTTSAGPSDADIAAETFGLAGRARALIVTADPGGQAAIWNTPGPAAATMSNVAVFLARTELTYPQLADLLKLSWLNPIGAMTLRYLDASGDLTKQIIDGLDDDALDRFHRFIRLWRATGWEPAVLDRAIRADVLGGGDITDGTLVALMTAEQVATRLARPVQDVLDLFDDLPWVGDDSRYATVFLSVPRVRTVEAAFLPANVADNEQADTVVPGSGVTLAEYRTYLALCLGVPVTDIDAALDTLPTGAIISAANIRRLYAVLLLADATGLTVGDVAVVRDLCGSDPLAAPAAALAYLDALADIRAAGLTPADLRYLLRHEADDLATRELADKLITDALTTLRAGYAQARATYRWVTEGASPNDLRTALRAVLTKLPGTSASTVNSLMSIVEGTYTDPTMTATAFVEEALRKFVPTDPITALVVAKPNDHQRAKLMRKMGGDLSKYLYRTAKDTLAEQTVATLLQASADLTGAMLSGHLHKPTSARNRLLQHLLTDDTIVTLPRITPADFDLQYRALRLLHMMAWLADRAGLTADDLSWMLAHNRALGWLAPDELTYQTDVPATPFATWRHFVRGVAFVRAHRPVANPARPDQPLRAHSLLELVLAPRSKAADVLDYFARLAGFDADLLKDIGTHLHLPLSAYQQAETFDKVTAAAVLLRRLGITREEAVNLTAATLSSSDATVLRRALKARYGEDSWLGVLGKVQSGLREAKRDALVAYLLAVNPDMTGPNDLYNYLLIDTEMSACMPTSRIVQAHATVQLFVQRCLTGIEPTCAADVRADSDWAQWEWMANFRTWEANVKVFLWPENWMIPGARDDRTEPYVALQNTLRQNELTDDVITDATAGYLESLDDLAHLDVMAAYYQTGHDVLHVFARTRGGDPPLYFYRTFQQERVWTPWQRVPLDITGDHLLAFERNDRLTLAWPLFTVEAQTDAQMPINPMPDQSPPPQKRLKIQMAIAELGANGKWRPKKVSKGVLPLPIDGSYIEKMYAAGDFNFFVTAFGDTAESIACVTAPDPSDSDLPGDLYIGSFALTGCHGYPEPNQQSGSYSNMTITPRFTNTVLRAEHHVEEPGPSHELEMATLLPGSPKTILKQTPAAQRFTVTHPMEVTKVDLILIVLLTVLGSMRGGSPYTSGREPRRVGIPLGSFLPFFYGDYERAYVIVPGFYQRERQQSGRSDHGLTFTDIDHLITDALALLGKYLKIYQEDPHHDLVALVKRLVADPEYIRLTAVVKDFASRRYGMRFENFYHPLVCTLRSVLYRDGIDGLMRRDVQLADTGFDFAKTYQPTSVVARPYPVENIDFNLSAAYGTYNWELFFHLPFDIADRLRTDQQFDRARAWLHYIFNPVGVIDPPDPANPSPPPAAPQKYWITKPFFQTTAAQYVEQNIDEIMYALASDPTGTAISDLAFAVSQWRDKPFRPYVVARSRPVAFQLATVMAYVGNLVDWGDSLFRQFTRESVTQATQLYLLADELLGPKPQIVPPAVVSPPETYNQLEPKIDLLANALIDLENLIPDLNLPLFDGTPLPSPITVSTLYFRVPPNEQMLDTWDLVADRLFKIRHCQNIDGVETPLALFAPPIDPGALVRAVAGGMSISAYAAGLGAPTPAYRFQVLSRQATELCGHVASLGNQLAGALERRDAEALAQLRASQEIAVLAAMRAVKIDAINEANGAITALQKSREVTSARLAFYSSQPLMNQWESHAADLGQGSLIGEAAVVAMQVMAGITAAIPDFLVGVAGIGGSPAANAGTGGTKVSKAAEMGSRAQQGLLRSLDKSAALAAAQGQHHRRQDEFGLQATVATKELVQIDTAITNAKQHVAMLNDDLTAHDLQTTHAQANLDFLTSKFTNEELYDWMVAQITAVYFSAYQLAFAVAKKAERCFEHELATDANFIAPNYWDSLRKGLMTADALLHDIKTMEVAYIDKNIREYELTKHISLAQLDPAALMQLKNTGSCFIEVPEVLFDLDHPGHYLRRLKTVSISLPCVLGPYTSVGARLSLVTNRYRKKTTTQPAGTNAFAKYAEQTTGDDRFVYNVGTIQSIATSTGVSDSGLFELNFNDDRYLPFEGAGAIGRWLLELPKTFRQFDYASISDVVLHLRYTAREGGSGLRSVVTGAMGELANQMVLSASAHGLYQGFRMSEQFPDALWQLRQTQQTQITVRASDLPYLVREHNPTILSTTWYATVTDNPTDYQLTVNGTVLNLARDPDQDPASVYKSAPGDTVALNAPVTIAADPTALTDLVAIIHYEIS
ncbi:Tc toxin subunit A-related protein [Streptomyces tendae]